MARNARWLLAGAVGVAMSYGVSAYAAADPSLIMLLSFEGSGEKAVDSSGKGNDAMLKGKAVRGAGKYGQGIDLVANAHLEVAHNASLNLQSMTLMTWCKIAADTGDHQSAIEKGPSWQAGEYNLLPDYGNKVMLQIFGLPENCDDEGEAGGVLDGTWHHIAASFDGKVIKIYVDGKVVGQRDCVGTLGTNTGPLFIGARGGTVRWTVGSYDEMAMYNRALTDAEVAKAMTGITTAVEPRDRATLMWGTIKSDALR